MPKGTVVRKGGYQSGQMGQTVNLLAYAYGGSNPSPPTTDLRNPASACLRAESGGIPQILRGNSSVDRALAFQAGGRGFESRFPLTRCNSSVVEHFLGKEEVLSSTLSYSSTSIKNLEIYTNIFLI